MAALLVLFLLGARMGSSAGQEAERALNASAAASTAQGAQNASEALAAALAAGGPNTSEARPPQVQGQLQGMVSSACPGCRQCAAESQPCREWWRVWAPQVPCCDGLECKQLLGGTGKTCARTPAQCVPEGGVCGGPGQLTRACCGSARCQRLLGGDRMQCTAAQPQCVSEGESCGGPGQLTRACCGSARCQRLLGGDGMQCVGSSR